MSITVLNPTDVSHNWVTLSNDAMIQSRVTFSDGLTGGFTRNGCASKFWVGDNGATFG